jgi:glycosyltransferase involved in cell wall biosynthesis
VSPEVSVVVPLHNEAENVAPLYDELVAVLRRLDSPYEVVLVDDGSRDQTFTRLTEVRGRDPRHVCIIRFTRNFGQTAAFAAGFAHARGRFIVTMDGDQQNDPTDIPRMLDLARTHDVVCGWRRNRKDAFLTRHVPSVVANRLIGLVSGVHLHDNGCSLKVFRADVVKPLRLSAGMHRYLPVLASRLGDRIAEVEVNHRPRRHGRSNYGLSRTFVVLRDLFRIRRLMREASSPAAPARAPYEVAEVLEASQVLLYSRRDDSFPTG